MSVFWRKGFPALLSVFFLIITGCAFLYIYLESQLPDVNALNTIKLQVPLRIYSADGLLIQEYGEKRRIPVAYSDIPPMLVKAVLVTEDQRFFEHPGIDILGLGRAAIQVVSTGSKSQGGSTITMQVARNFFLNRKKTLWRKLNEIMLAIKIDKELSKEKILELYLNKIYLGNRAYGVGAAAQIYYGKSLSDLSLGEIAMIAGLPQAPSVQNPINNPISAEKRRNHVLSRLYEEHIITEQQYNKALKEPVATYYHGAPVKVNAPYVAEMIRQSLYDYFGEAAYTKGYKVYTTIRADLQNTARDAIEDNLIAYGKRHGYKGPVGRVKDLNALKIFMQEPNYCESKDYSINGHKQLSLYPILNDLYPALILSVSNKSAKALVYTQNCVTLNWDALSWARPRLRKGWMGSAPNTAQDVVKVGDIVYVRMHDDKIELAQIPEVESAVVAINPNDGAIEALVGGFNFIKSKFNRATQSSRQPGSSFKPFIYTAALDKGYTLATLIKDAPIVVEDTGQAKLWRPHNANMQYNGPTRLKDALVRSRNTVSIRILDDIGIKYAVEFASRFGFNPKNLPKSLSLALGSLSVSPLDMAVAYCVFANGGYKIEPYLITKITDDNDKVLLTAKPTIACDSCTLENGRSMAPRVLEQDTTFLMHTALQDVIKHGTGSAATVLKRPDIAGKTGTTNDQVDAWFVGYNPDIVVTAWVGYDIPRSLHEYAAGLALPLWIDVMREALKGKPIKMMPQPDNVVTVRIDPKTGLLTHSSRDEGINEYFRDNEIPNAQQLQEDIPTQEETLSVEPENTVPQFETENVSPDENSGAEEELEKPYIDSNDQEVPNERDR